jgi:mRNA interferase RelE/StbE
VYNIGILPRTRKALGRLPEEVYVRVLAEIQALATNPRPPGCVKLRNRDAWRIRVGDYRVIYEIDDDQQIITVVEAGHRRDVYRS